MTVLIFHTFPPTAATVDAINDEYGPVAREVLVAEQPARFKVGDVAEVVRCRPGMTSQIGKQITIARVSGERLYAPCSGCEEMIFYADELEHAAPATPTPAIVCKIDNGQPLPATRPVVHSTVEAADAEAKRLANLHTGQEFGVYRRAKMRTGSEWSFDKKMPSKFEGGDDYLQDWLCTPATQLEYAELSSVLGRLSGTRDSQALVRLAMGDELQDVAVDFGVSRERVRQLAERERNRLRKAVG